MNFRSGAVLTLTLLSSLLVRPTHAAPSKPKAATITSDQATEETFLVRVDGKEILVEDLLGGDPITLNQWRKREKPMDRVKP